MALRCKRSTHMLKYIFLLSCMYIHCLTVLADKLHELVRVWSVFYKILWQDLRTKRAHSWKNIHLVVADASQVNSRWVPSKVLGKQQRFMSALIKIFPNLDYFWCLSICSCPPEPFYVVDIHTHSPHINKVITSWTSITIHKVNLNLNNESMHTDYCCQVPEGLEWLNKESSISELNISPISACTYGAVKLIKCSELPNLFFNFICFFNGVFVWHPLFCMSYLPPSQGAYGIPQWGAFLNELSTATFMSELDDFLEWRDATSRGVQEVKPASLIENSFLSLWELQEKGYWFCTMSQSVFPNWL